MKKKIFDWSIAQKMHSPAMIDFLARAQGTGMSEEEFVACFILVPVRQGEAIKGRRTPSNARQNYRNLRDKFDFFS